MVRVSMIWFLRFFNNMNILLQRDQRLDTGYNTAIYNSLQSFKPKL